MKVVATKKRLVEFAQVRTAGTFVWEDHVHLKLACSFEDFNAVRLTDGRLCIFGARRQVEPTNHVAIEESEL